MNFVRTQRTATHLRAALLAALVLSAPLLAANNDGEVGLMHNERAAQDAIVQSPNGSSTTFPNDTRSTTLADNENAAKRVISDIDTTRSTTAAAATDEPTLAQNEAAAQRVIVDLPRPRRVPSAITNASLVPAATVQASPQR